MSVKGNLVGADTRDHGYVDGRCMDDSNAVPVPVPSKGNTNTNTNMNTNEKVESAAESNNNDECERNVHVRQEPNGQLPLPLPLSHWQLWKKIMCGGCSAPILLLLLLGLMVMWVFVRANLGNSKESWNDFVCDDEEKESAPYPPGSRASSCARYRKDIELYETLLILSTLLLLAVPVGYIFIGAVRYFVNNIAGCCQCQRQRPRGSFSVITVTKQRILSFWNRHVRVALTATSTSFCCGLTVAIIGFLVVIFLVTQDKAEICSNFLEPKRQNCMDRHVRRASARIAYLVLGCLGSCGIFALVSYSDRRCNNTHHDRATSQYRNPQDQEENWYDDGETEHNIEEGGTGEMTRFNEELNSQ